MNEREHEALIEFDLSFCNFLKEPRNQDMLSAGIKMGGKTAFEVLQEYALLWKNKRLEYQPRMVSEAFLRFAFERNATSEEIVKVAIAMGRAFPVDQALEI